MWLDCKREPAFFRTGKESEIPWDIVDFRFYCLIVIYAGDFSDAFVSDKFHVHFFIIEILDNESVVVI